MRLAKEYKCEQCNLTFNSAKDRSNHARTHKQPVFESIGNNGADLEPTLTETATSAEVPSFDPSAPRSFKAGCNFEAGDEGHVYDEINLTEQSFTGSELYSIDLYDLMTEFQSSVELHRRLVNLMNTLIKNYDKLANDSLKQKCSPFSLCAALEYEPKILHGNAVTNLFKKKVSLNAHECEICGNACELYDINKQENVYKYCKKKDAVSNEKMKMMSLGDQLARLVGNDDVRKKLKYRSEREEVPGVISDYFDGADYKAFKANNLFQSPEDIAIA
ncbi:hypothetical protein ABG067_008046, partial [Albugo candida]